MQTKPKNQQKKSFLSLQDFSLDKMYDEDYTLEQLQRIFKKLNKEWRTLDQKHATLLEEIHDYLAENFHKCCVCEIFFEDHEYTNSNQDKQECHSCFTYLFSQ